MQKEKHVNQNISNSEILKPRAGKLRSLICSSVAVLGALCLFTFPSCAKAACGRYDAPGLKTTVKLPMMAQAAEGFRSPFESERPTIVGLWHVIYTNGADQSTFNDTFDTWHSDGTEFESAFLAPAGGDVCVGVWKESGRRSVTLHHVGWLFNPSTPTATATNTFSIDSELTVAEDGRSYSGRFTFKVWNLDGTPTPVEVTGTIAATRITVN
jgi:hypothetical protein